MFHIQRCFWCAYPLQVSDTHVVVRVNSELSMFVGTFCNGCCAMSYYDTFKPNITRILFTQVLLAELHQTSDAEFDHAPPGQFCEWWSPGGKSRQEFLALCTTRYRTLKVKVQARDFNSHDKDSTALFNTVFRAITEK